MIPKEAELLLANLKTANDWELCRISLTKLAPLLKAEEILQIIIEKTTYFLTRYQQQNPIDISFDDLSNVNTFEELSRKSYSLRESLQSARVKPGINTYRAGLEHLIDLKHFNPNSKRDIMLFVDAISAIIVSIEDYVWGTTHRDLWERALKREYKEDLFILSKHFITDPEVINLNQQLWGKIASSIEKHTS